MAGEKMAYKALYRTYRPQVFEDVVGQKYVLQTLKNAINEGKIAHAYLFSGPRGTGKTTLAKLLAKGTNCTSSGNKPCGVCDNCLAIARGNHPDVVEIDAASNNGVDEVRELVDKVKYTPVQGKYKVYIIDEVHMMSAGAFNALLKTLEEPPAHVIFILATTEVHKVLPTIISRCQRFDFGRVSVQDIKKRIIAVLKQENIQYDEAVVPFIASLADGGVRDALGILDQALAYTSDQISLQDIRDIFGIATNEEIHTFMQLIEQGEVEKVLYMIEDFDAKGIDLIRLTSMLIDIYKSIVIYHKSKSTHLYSTMEIEKLKTLTLSISVEKAFYHINVLIEALTNYKKINTPKSFFELATLKMCNQSKKEAVESLENIPVAPLKKEVKTVKIESVGPSVVFPSIVEKTRVIAPSSSTMDTASQPIEKETELSSSALPKQEAPIHIVETSIIQEKEEDDEGDLVYSEADLMNILVQSDKMERNALTSKWSLIKRYLIKPAFAKAASLIIDGSPYAVSDQAIIFVFEDEPQANQLNDSRNQQLAQLLIEEIHGKTVYCYGISETYSRLLTRVFLTHHKENNLPAPKPILAPVFKKRARSFTPNNPPKPEDETLKVGKQLFGDLLEIKGE